MTEGIETHLALGRLVLDLLSLSRLCFFLNHTKERVTPALQLLRTAALEEPIESENGEFRDIPLDALVHIIGTQPVVVESAKKVSVLFFAVDLALRRRVVKLELLHRVPHRGDLLRKQCFEVRTLVALRLALFDAGFDARVLGELLPLLLEDVVVLSNLFWRLRVYFLRKQVELLSPTVMSASSDKSYL